MGNSQSTKIKTESISRDDCFKKIFTSNCGELMQCCSYGKWVRLHKSLCGFTDFADYTTARESRQRYGVLVKPDTTDGRYFITRLKSKWEIIIAEKATMWATSVKLPKVPPPITDAPNWFRQSHYNRNQRECSMVGYHDELAVIQIQTNRSYSTSLFYVIDLRTKKVVSHFAILYHGRRWYECYISPNKKRVLLRPDHITRIVVLPDNYIIRNLHTNTNDKLRIETLPSIYRAHVMTFNSLAGDNAMVFASNKDIEIRSLDTWEVLRQTQNLELPADIQQIKSSDLGDFLAVRCVYPVHSKEYSTNIIAVLDYSKFSILFTVDVKGCYWPVSEVINLQVFPRFSPSEASVAVMRNCAYKRKVFTYKLPIIRRDLQHLCRRSILHLVNMKDVGKLPLPLNLIHFLKGTESY